MKIPITIYCSLCKVENTIAIELHDPYLDFTCSSCGERNEGPFDLGFTVGDRILSRAHYELYKNHDPTMSIIFSAMAMECEISWMHHKWEGIKGLMNFTQMTDSELDEQLRRLGNIADKIEKVARLMYPLGLETFVASRANLCDTIRNDFPDLLLGQLAISFQQTLFWRRNRILHLADTNFDEAVASRCFKLAVLGIHIFQQLDLEGQKGV